MEEYEDENILENVDDEDEEMVNENYKNDNENENNVNNEKMGPPNIQIKPPGTKQKRRSKNDSNGRDYVCGCGKTYLSYPALYTHIKTKHNGRTPDGTNANQIQSGGRGGRGRPRKNFLINDDLIRSRRERLESGLEERHPEFRDIYNKQNNIQLEDMAEKEEIYLNIFQTLGLLGDPSDPEEAFSDFINSSIKEKYLPIYEKIKYIENNNLLNKLLYNNESEDNNETNQGDTSLKVDPSNLVCDDIFALFLLDSAELFSMNFYKTLIIFIKTLRDCMNKLGWEIFSQYKIISEEKTDLDFCSIKNAEYIPEITNEFMNIYLPNKLPNFDTYLGNVLLNYFCDWIYKNRFTNTKIKYLNDEVDI